MEWIQLTPTSELPAEEAEWMMRVFSNAAHGGRMRPIIHGRYTTRQFNFCVLREIDVTYAEVRRTAIKWCKTMDDDDDIVWRCQDGEGAHTMDVGESSWVQFLFRPPMNDFVMK